MEDFREFVYIFRPKRDNFIGTLTAAEQAILAQHQHYCHHLPIGGRLLRADLSLNGVYGICVFQAPSTAAAVSIFENDPAVRTGLVQAELHHGLSDFVPRHRQQSTSICKY